MKIDIPDRIRGTAELREIIADLRMVNQCFADALPNYAADLSTAGVQSLRLAGMTAKQAEDAVGDLQRVLRELAQTCQTAVDQGARALRAIEATVSTYRSTLAGRLR